MMYGHRSPDAFLRFNTPANALSSDSGKLCQYLSLHVTENSELLPQISDVLRIDAAGSIRHFGILVQVVSDAADLLREVPDIFYFASAWDGGDAE